MKIVGVDAKAIKDSRGDDTISVLIKTDVGNFSASSPQGKSTGRNAVKLYKKSLEGDINTLKEFSDYFSEEILEEFEDLKRIEDIVEGHIGGNSLLALECAVLKAMAHERKKEVWEIINPKAKKIPRLVGNCIGGGKHSELVNGWRPDFQEFLLIPNSKSVEKSLETNLNAKRDAEMLLKESDKNFKSKKNDEDAWMVSLNDKEVFDILKKLGVPIGTDIASSSFYKRKKYLYENPMLKRDSDEQLSYLTNLVKNYSLFYIEDPFGEEEFESFSLLLKKFSNSLIVGDDLTVTSSKRLKKAIEMKAINALIVKPNQCGSLIEVKKVVEMAKENGIKMVFSHRSGETGETILADLAFGFGADFFKCGITGIRAKKIERLIEIEKRLK
jgi:enolase